MPSLSSPIGTTQPYIPALAAAQLGRFAGLFMLFADVAALVAAVGTASPASGERGNITNGTPLWAAGQRFAVAAEPSGVYRVWSVGANAAASHARTVVLRPGLAVVLAGDANTVLTTAGAPASGVGAVGDIAVDYAAGIYYLKSGTWVSQGSIYPTASVGTSITTNTVASNAGVPLQLKATEAASGNNATDATLAGASSALATRPAGSAIVQGGNNTASGGVHGDASLTSVPGATLTARGDGGISVVAGSGDGASIDISLGLNAASNASVPLTITSDAGPLVTMDESPLGTRRMGFLGAAAIAKPAVSGSRGGNAALASLLTALASLGLITNNTTA